MMIEILTTVIVTLCLVLIAGELWARRCEKKRDQAHWHRLRGHDDRGRKLNGANR